MKIFRLKAFLSSGLIFSAVGLSGCSSSLIPDHDLVLEQRHDYNSEFATCVDFVDVEEGRLALYASRQAHWVTSSVFKVPDPPIIAIRDITLPESECEFNDVLIWSFKQADLPYLEQIRSLIPHEVGHLVLFNMQGSKRDDQYGSDAPDWIDEAFAMAYESEDTADQRLYDAVRLAAAGLLFRLPAFLEMEHPQLQGLLDSGPIEGPAVFEIDPETGMATAIFYAQSFLFQEYLVYLTNNSAILSEIASEIKKGALVSDAIVKTVSVTGERDLSMIEEGFEAWLASDPQLALPRYSLIFHESD
tara:strand:+ start:2723 stop:3631 length:909 start_codon:yes stop_codon:yes gene_type:complete